MKLSIQNKMGNKIDLTWTDAAAKYREFCLQAVNDENVFSTFRRNPIFTQIMEHFTYDQGLKYLNAIKDNNPKLLEYFDDFKSSENNGSPIVFEYNNVFMSPSTLRYIKVLSDLFNCFGSLEGFKIAEIGSGYGGQCKIIKDIYNVDYYLIDLPEVNLLAKKYLEKTGIKDMRFYSYNNLVKEKYDLVISNHAFSELNRNIQDYYNEMIIQGSKNGYMTCNIMLNNNDCYQLPDYEKMGTLHYAKEEPNTHRYNFVMYWYGK